MLSTTKYRLAFTIPSLTGIEPGVPDAGPKKTVVSARALASATPSLYAFEGNRRGKSSVSLPLNHKSLVKGFMYMNLNRAELIGNLVADPVAKTLPSGKDAIQFIVATSYYWKDGSNPPKQQVNYHAVTAFGQLGKVILKYLKKGDRIYVAGRMRTSRWKVDGKIKNSHTVIIAENLIMLGSKKQDEKDQGNDNVVVEEIEIKKGEG